MQVFLIYVTVSEDSLMTSFIRCNTVAFDSSFISLCGQRPNGLIIQRSLKPQGDIAPSPGKGSTGNSFAMHKH